MPVSEIRKVIKIVKNLIENFETKLDDRSYWKSGRERKRIEEIEAIQEALELVKKLIKITTPEE